MIRPAADAALGPVCSRSPASARVIEQQRALAVVTVGQVDMKLAVHGDPGRQLLAEFGRIVHHRSGR